MNKPHKHADLIKKWADGAEIEYAVDNENNWFFTSCPNWEYPFCQFRIKRPDWQQKLIDAAKEGKKVQVFRGSHWVESAINDVLDDYGFLNRTEDMYRIEPEFKPESKPDNEILYSVYNQKVTQYCRAEAADFKIIFDGKTGAYKGVESLK